MQQSLVSPQLDAALERINTCMHTQPEEAIRLCEQVFVEARELREALPHVMAAVCYGSIMDHLGRQVEARNALFDALQVAQSAHLFANEAELLGQIARGYYTAGQYRQAIQYWARGVEVSDQAGRDARTWILAKVGLGQVYYALGDFQSAAVLHADAETRVHEVDDAYLDAKVKINLGVDLYEMHRNDEATAVLLRAVDICVANRFLDYASESNFRLGQIELRKGALDLAMAYLDAALIQARQVNYRWGEANILMTQAEVQAGRANYQAAMETVREAQAIATPNSFEHMLMNQHFAAARYAEALGDIATALAEFKAGHTYEQKIISGSAPERSRELEDKAGLRPNASGLLAELSNNRLIDEGRPAEAFQLIAIEGCRILELARASVWLLDMPGDALQCQCLYLAGPGEYASEVALQREDYPAYFDWLDDPNPLVAHDAAHHPYVWELEQTYLNARGIKSMLAFAIRAAGRTVGVLCFEVVGAQRNWAPDDIINGSQLADICARVVVGNERRLFQHEISTLNTQLMQANEVLEARVTERTAALERRNAELVSLNEQLTDMQHQLLQSEKMASIGQLAAGVAHEINNPIGYVYSNLSSLEKYLGALLSLLADYEAVDPVLPEAERTRLANRKRDYELDYLRADLPQLMLESREGITRVKKIVMDLREFSHSDTGEMALHDIHQGLNSTLNLVNAELQKRATLVCKFGELPPVECSLARLNQVFLNLLINAAHALGQNIGEIRVSTGCEGDQVWISISDNGSGIKPEHMKKIFDAFFTTKPVGQGTGLGLSLSYSIIQAHHGRIEVDSTEGIGTTFTIWLPIKQPAD